MQSSICEIGVAAFQWVAESYAHKKNTEVTLIPKGHIKLQTQIPYDNAYYISLILTGASFTLLNHRLLL
jgi:hypothetical protein